MKYWNCAVDDAVSNDGGGIRFSEMAAETRVGKRTMITGQIETDCGYGPEIWETPDPSKP